MHVLLFLQKYSSLLMSLTQDKVQYCLVPFFRERQDLPRFPEFLKKTKSYKRYEIALHGLYHEDRSVDSMISIQYQK